MRVAERKLKVPSGKNPARVLAGKRAWNALSARQKALRGAAGARALGHKSKSKGKPHMAKGKKGKGHKRGGYRKRVRAASHTLGKLIKAIAVLAPAAAIGVVSYNFFGKGWKAVVPAIMDFSSCFTGVKLGDNGEPVFIPERLIAG